MDALHNILKWAFDGCGATALGLLIGAYFAKRSSAKDSSGDDNSVTNSADVGHRASSHASPVIHGSHNVVNVSANIPPEAAQATLTELLVTWGAVMLVFALVLGVSLYIVNHPDKADASTTQPSGPTSAKYHVNATIGIAYSNDRSALTNLWAIEPNCVAMGIHCLAEEKTKGKTISIPVAAGQRTIRIAVMLMSNDELYDSEITATTSDPSVSLNHVDQDDGTIHNHIDFTPSQILLGVSTTGYPNASLVDIKFPATLTVIPLTLSVEPRSSTAEDDWVGPTINTSIRLVRH